MEDKRVIQAGHYIGAIDDYGISTNQKGDAQVFIKFKINKGEGQGYADLIWFGSLSDKKKPEAKKSPAQYTISTLLDCDFSGQEVEDMAGGPANEVLRLGKEMALEIEDNQYNDKLTSRIKWVNIIGAGGVKRVSKEELTGKTNTSALRAMLLKEKETRPPTEDVGF